MAPWADVLYFADWPWAKKHMDGVHKAWPWVSFTPTQVKEAFAAFQGEKVSVEGSGMMNTDTDVALLHNAGSDGLSDQPNAIFTGSNSGYQAINLAVLAGATKLLLVGYDMKYEGVRTHSHNGHGLNLAENHYSYNYARRYFGLVKPLEERGVQVVTCNPNSMLRAFPRGRLEDHL